MEGEVGAQVAAPIFLHQPLPGLLGKKRDLSWQNPSFHHHQQSQAQSQPPPPPRGQTRLMGCALPSTSTNWNPNMWEWDSVRFAARPSSETSDALLLGARSTTTTTPCEAEQRRGSRDSSKPATPLNNSRYNRGFEDDGENLTLKLGGGSYVVAEEPVVRPNKRVRSGSPGNGGSYPMCQVDDCRADLSNAKDYHRRHKVCELHSKTTKALVGKQMQRFCQQCSRFHLLSEFDEGKRSCRRRLAGHNRRRRKTQPEDASSRSLLPGNQESSGNGSLDIVNLLAILARLQGSTAEKLSNLSSLPDKDRLVQILSKISSMPAADATSRLPVSGGFDLNVAQASQQCSVEQVTKTNGNTSAASTMDLLAVLSAAPVVSPSMDTQASLSQGSSDVSGNDKARSPCAEPVVDVISQNKLAQVLPVNCGRSHSCALESSVEVSQHPIQEAQPSLPLQLFSSAEDDSPPKMGSYRKYFSSESSNPTEDRSPSSSPPVAQKLFPLHSVAGTTKHVRMSICREDNSTVEVSTSHGWNAPLELFKDSERRAETGVVRHLPYQAGYASSSGSDHSPSSSNSDAQDRTGRIIFKLFDKDPSNFPGTLRSQILNWLSHSPSEMESYIRPGCVVLSIYVSMPSTAWDELEEDLLQRVNSLLQYSDSDFWRSGRFLVRTSRQLASHKDGKIRICKSWGTWSAPELTSVSPVAVVSGQETSLVLRGRNLTVPGTKIHCTYMGGYTSKEILGSAYPGTIYDDLSWETFNFPGGSPNVFGRCFIEVENGFKGNSFPIIIADATICQELRGLESEFELPVGLADVIREDQIQDYGRPRSREDVLRFLNELGWLFQKRGTSSSLFSTDFSTTRFKFLFAFSVERDWSAIIKTLLDMLVERSSTREGLYQESLEMLVEVQLLSRAVKRKCRKIVDLLLNYSVKIGVESSKVYLFPPNMMGPGGVTPLHIAASTQDSEDMVDALTNDPQEIGLNCWNSLWDDNHHSPFMYASMRSNHSYNRLVARKLADRRSGQISIMLGSEESQSGRMGEPDKLGDPALQAKSCARCVLMERRGVRPSARTKGLLQRPYVHSLLAIAAVCVCVCLIFRGSPQISSRCGNFAPFKWENLKYGPR